MSTLYRLFTSGSPFSPSGGRQWAAREPMVYSAAPKCTKEKPKPQCGPSWCRLSFLLRQAPVPPASPLLGSLHKYPRIQFGRLLPLPRPPVPSSSSTDTFQVPPPPISHAPKPQPELISPSCPCTDVLWMMHYLSN